MEIERKFLVDTLPDLDGVKFDKITQAYLSITPEARVRKRGEKYYYTEKGEGALVREEIEREITRDEYETLFEKSEGRVLEKTRYCIPYLDHIIELDIYEGRHAGLIVAEIEFSSEAQAHSFVAPDWLGKEITYDISFRNKILACT
ncbi:MAG: CYTH domain-containing protein [Clostridia bacterium]|nr:CYTH domain-containing protein [Clostridia bacterium]